MGRCRDFKVGEQGKEGILVVEGVCLKSLAVIAMFSSGMQPQTAHTKDSGE